MDESALSGYLQKLNLGLTQNKVSSDVEKSLSQLLRQISAEGADKKAVVGFLVQNGIVDTVSSILKKKDSFPVSVLAAVSEILAEVAKLDSGRQASSQEAIIISLLDLLLESDANVLLQVCRALGNICYDNDTARGLVKEHDGVSRLIQLLKNLLEKENLPQNMRTITSGCLLNLTDTYEEIQEQALDAGILDILMQYLMKFHSDDDVVTHCLLVLGCLAETNSGREKILETPILSSLLQLLETPSHDDVLESLLDLFGYLCENDAAKLTLARMGLCEKLVQILNKHRNSENVRLNFSRSIPELIILILTGDASMEYLWKDGKGLVYKESLAWLKSADENLLVSGALAAGNFARKDGHCIQMMKDGFVDILNVHLKKQSKKDGDIRMQHAVLSALRNLAIPVENKLGMVEVGVVPNLMEMMEVETFPVVFKLLGTLRMLIDKQEDVAKAVGADLAFVERLVCWSRTEDHLGVQGEATRLLAWLAKNSKCSTVVKNLVKANAVPPIVTMVKSEHILMQNEGLVALTFIALLRLSDIEDIAESTDLVNVLHQVMSEDVIVPEVIQNVLSLFLVLAVSPKLKPMVSSVPIQKELKTLQSHSDERIKELSSKVLKML